MPGLLSALEGFCVIGIVIGTGYVAARMRIGGPTAQMVLNRFSFFVSSPCLMFAILSKERILEIFHSSIVVAFFSAVLVGLVFLILNRLFFHLKAADATIGALNSLYLNSNNIGLPIATYILGNPALVAPILVMQQAVFTVAVLKNIVMPIIAFLLSYFVMGFRGATLYACVVLAALPTGQNVYNYAARYNLGLSFARDGILFSTLTSPIFIAIIAVLLG